MSAEENEALVRRYFAEVWSQGQLEAIDALVAADFVRHSTTTPDGVRGPAALKDYVARNRGAFHDFRVTVEDLLASADKVAVRWSGRGVHRGDFLGVAPTGKPVLVAGTNILHLAGGKLVAEWSHFDGVGLLHQLGVLPPLSASAP